MTKNDNFDQKNSIAVYNKLITKTIYIDIPINTITVLYNPHAQCRR